MAKTQKVLLITTGGTINASIDAKGVRVADGNSATGADLLSSVQRKIAAKGHNIEIAVHAAYNIDSLNANPRHWEQLINILAKNYDEFDSFIITHGTDTMGYTAVALSLGLGNFGKPVLITGSQVPISEYGDDARTNLENCIRIIHDSQEMLRGVFAVVGSSLMAGSRVRKMDGTKYQAFGSHGSFDLAQFGATYDISYNQSLADYTEFYGARADKAADLAIWNRFDMRSVFTIPEHPGISIDVIRDIIKNKEIKAIIWRAYGAGDPNLLSRKVLSNAELMQKNFLNDYDLRGIFELAQTLKKPIIMTSDVEKSIVSMDVYDPGMIAFMEYGVIPTFDMSPAAAIVKTAYLLAKKTPYEHFKTAMMQNLRGEIDPIKVKRFLAQMKKRGLG